MQRAAIPPFYIFICHDCDQCCTGVQQGLQAFWQTSRILLINDWTKLDEYRELFSNSLFLLCGSWATPKHIRYLRRFLSSGLIFVCANNDQDSAADAMAALRAGADEYQVIAELPASEICERVKESWRGSSLSGRAKRAEVATPESMAQLQTLHDLSLALTGILSVEELMDHVYAYTKMVLAPETFVAAVYDDVEQNYLTFYRSEEVKLLDNHQPTMRIDPFNDHEGSGALGWMIRQRQPIHVRDLLLQSDIPIVQITKTLPRTWVGLPLIIYDQVVGALSIHSTIPRAFSDEQVRTFYALASQIGLALQGARLYKSEMIRHQFTEVLHGLSTSLIKTKQREQIFTLAGEATKSIFNQAHSVNIALFSDEYKYSTRVYEWFSMESTLENRPPDRILVSDSYFLPQLIQDKKTLIVEDSQDLTFDSERFAILSFLCRQGLRTAIFVPLISNEKLIGVFYIDFWHQHRRFSPIQIQAVESIASRTAVGLENIRLRGIEQQRRVHAEILHDLSGQLIRTVNQGEIFSSVEQAIRTIFPRVVDISFFLLDPSKEYFHLMHIWIKDSTYNVVAGERFQKEELVQNYQVLVSKETDVIDNISDYVSQDPQLYVNLQQLADSGLNSTITLPLVVQGQGIGTIWLGFWHEHERFSSEQIQLLESIAGHTAVALDSFRVYEMELTRRHHAEALHRLSERLMHTADQQQIFEYVVDALLNVFPHMQDCSFSFIDDSGDHIVRTNAWTSNDQYEVCYTETRFAIKDLYLAKAVLVDMETIAIADIHEMEWANEHPGDAARNLIECGLRACVTLPLVVNKVALGSLWIGFWDQVNYCTPEQIQFCESVVGHAATALENVRLYERETGRRQQSEVLHTLSGNLMHSSDSPWIFDQTVAAVRAIFPDVDDVSFSLLDKNNEYLVREHVWFSHPELNLLGDRPKFLVSDLKLASKALDDVQTVVVEDIHALNLSYEQKESPSRTIVEGGMRSVVYLPLLVKGEVTGLVGAVFWNTPRQFTFEEIQTIEAVAGHVAVAMENVRLYDELHHHIYARSLLNDVAMSNSAAVNLDRMLEYTTEVIARAFNYQSFGFYLPDKEMRFLVPHKSYYFSGSDKSMVEVPLDGSFIGRCVAEREMVVTGNLYEEPRYYITWEKVRSVIGVPLLVDNEVVAVINAESEIEDAFDEEDWSFLNVLAGQMNSAWQRVLLHQRIQQQADDLSKQVDIRTAQLQAERDRLEIILASAGEGIFFTDTLGVIAYANPALVAQSGFSLDMLIGRPSSVLGSQETSREVFDELWANILGGKRWRGELINQHKDGRTYTVNMTITPILGPHDAIEGFVAVQSDITYLKELDRLKSEFVSNVSHELRTPLTNISMYLKLMERGRAEKQEQYLSVLHQETDRLTSLIQDLLSLSQLESGGQSEFEWIDIVNMLNMCRVGFEARVQAKNLTVVQLVEDDLPEILGDRGQVNQVIINLLGNAIAYTPPNGRISIKIQVHVNQHGSVLTIEIADDGVGIATDEIDRLFDRFYRGSAAVKTRSPGTGLGLAICREIMERHRGGVSVTSELGVGSVFTIWFPLSDLPQQGELRAG